ncbi:P22 phage major capsid protein family protein [Nocardia xishanensis]|uniref:P22 phage major capsid protein family protein n=1 Tax=Nocardia xishanensis TaxID=238964 RepID=UPI00082B8277|nr:P22 phage major capsid protein family protein [Nocardia xishanensis]
MTDLIIGVDAIAKASVNTMRELIKQPLNVDACTQFGPHKPGDTVEVRKAGTEDETISVQLNTVADVAFAVTSEDLTLPFNDFRDKFIVPAMDVLAKNIDRSMRAAGQGAQFASAPLPLPVVDERFCAVVTLDGISLRVVEVFDIARCETVMAFDVLYGVAVAEQAEAA